MALSSSKVARHGRKAVPGAFMVLALLILPSVCMAQSLSQSEQTGSVTQSKPLTDYERAELMRLIHELQDRVTKLEARTCPAPAATSEAKAQPAIPTSETMVDGVTVREPEAKSAGAAKNLRLGRRGERVGEDTHPTLGFKLADTEHGDLSLSIYTYARYLNQLALNSTYTDAFGNVKNIQRRQDVQIQKLQFKFLGWMVDPRFRYFLYAWTSNATQGQGAQVVLAGNLSFKFSDHFTFAGGIRSLPGTRSVEGNFPFWLGVDSRMITDEFMRPSYTSGIWATGDITERLKYHVMVGNNMSTLGVSASRLDNGLNTFSSALHLVPYRPVRGRLQRPGLGRFRKPPGLLHPPGASLEPKRREQGKPTRQRYVREHANPALGRNHHLHPRPVRPWRGGLGCQMEDGVS